MPPCPRAWLTLERVVALFFPESLLRLHLMPMEEGQELGWVRRSRESSTSPHAVWVLYEIGFWGSRWGAATLPCPGVATLRLRYIASKDPPFPTLAKSRCRQMAKSREGWVGCRKKWVSICLYVCTHRSAVKPHAWLNLTLFLILNVLR